MRQSFVVWLLFLVMQLSGNICNGRSGSGLRMRYYHKTCPAAEYIAKNITWTRVSTNPTLPAKLLRLHYHDCFVRGCDASILLDATSQNNTPEKAALPNRSLSGYDIIDEIKSKVEEECPGVVSCADIVALAARDAVSYQFQRKMWPVYTGRKDGRISLASEATTDLPSPFANFTNLLAQFTSKGLNMIDLVTLSGAHTIGVTRCVLFARRLRNFTTDGGADPSLNPNYVEKLKEICPAPPNSNTTVEMDPNSSLSFDTHYFKGLNRNKGIFTSDAALLTNRRSAHLARLFENREIFFASFAHSMVKMSAMGVLTNGDGEVRQSCRVVN